MTDFETRLRTRLERLDAAIPQPAAPAIPARSGNRPHRRRQVLLLVAATAVLALGTALVTLGSPPPVDPQQQARNASLEDRVNRMLLPLFPGQECIGQEEAVRRLRHALDERGFSDWEIRNDSSVAGSRCVSFGASAGSKAVIVTGRLEPGLPQAMDRMADQLLEQCLNRSQAAELVASTMAGIGITDFAVSADPWGPKAAPVDKWDAYQQHVADGCFVYVFTQLARDGSGRPVVYLWGPWP